MEVSGVRRSWETARKRFARIFSFSLSMRSSAPPGVFNIYTTENGFGMTRSTVQVIGFSVPLRVK